MKRTLDSYVCLLLFSLCLQFGYSQNSDEPATITDKFVIENVFINARPGQTPSFGSILIEDGMIKQIGTSVNFPFDAEIIDGDSMHVYAGFIDALSHTAIKAPEENKDSPKVKNPGNPSNEAAGITPHKSAASMLSAKEKSIKDLRSAGVTMAHVVPSGKMLPGKGAVILLNGESPEDMLLREDMSMYAQFKGAGRMYPATIIGVMAKFRELYRGATYAQKHSSDFSKNPSGIQRPSHDKELNAFFPVIDKNQKIFFKADKALTVQRALALQKELGFPIVLSDLKNATKAIQKIKTAQADVLLSFDLPKEEKEDRKEDDAEDKKASKDGKPAEAKEKSEKLAKGATEGSGEKSKKKKAKKKEKKDPEKEKLEARKKNAVAEYVAHAATMEKNNIPFSFSFLSGKAKDLHNNIRRMIAAGLSEKTALESLTINPAKLLGISNVCGTLEKGKLANIVMTDKPYFEEKAKITYVFVEGTPYKSEEKKKKKKSSDGDSGVNIAGEWSYEMDIPMPNNTGIIKIEKTEDTYTVSIASVDDLTDFEVIEDVELAGDNLVFDFDIDNDGFQMNIGMDLTFDGDSFEGTTTAGQFGTFNMTGNRTSNPE